MWNVVIEDGKGDVIPLHDLIEHTRGQTCACKPFLDEGWLSIHHAADGRERSEPDCCPERFEEAN